ncbi:unnamed protein product [Soboliphyme baturini]|uniref:Uncharacterized protein n=1 Tax=Soboliphyme baturini TaxID=241478 RepID=A0A183J8A5_9BILA|nr:unnamed protein product [Soboliphyme baturini]
MTLDVGVGDMSPLTPKTLLPSLSHKTQQTVIPHRRSGSNYASIDPTRTKALHCSSTNRNADVFVKRTRHDCLSDHSR